MLQEIADADLAEAPTRLAFETGAEGDRHRRYVLANERVLNRRFSLFLEARKRSEAGACRPSSPVSGPSSVGALGPFDRPDLDRGEVVEPEKLGRSNGTIEPGQPTFLDECDPNTDVLEPWPEEFLTTEMANLSVVGCPLSVVSCEVSRLRSPPFRWETARPAPRSTMLARTGTTSRRLP